MGGSSVPSSTSQYQQVATGIWGSPQATKLALPILKPALANIKNQQDMLMGFQKGDPEQTRKFFGLSADAPAEEAVHAIGQLNKPVTSQVQYQPPKTAAHGGIMSLEDEPVSDPRKFASGGDTAPKKPKPPKEVTWSDAQESRRNELIAKQQANQKLTPQERNVLNSLNKRYQGYQTYTDYNKQQAQTAADTTAIQDAARQAGLAPAQAYINQAGYFGFDPTAYAEAIKRGDLAGTTTNPLYAQAIRQLQSMEKQPEQFGQATQAYQSAISGLQNAAQYQPQQVTGKDVQGAQLSRSAVRDINAIMADVEKYQAAGMQAPPALQAEAYQAAQMQGAQMQGPKSWTDPGTARQYMNPYTQNVLESQLGLSNRQFAQQQNQLRSQAAQQKAFGGSRQAIAEQNAQLNQNIANQNMVAQGLQQAYGQGMQQFSTEQNQALQAGQANLQAALTAQQQNQAALNNQRSLYVQQALDAAKTSYGGELTAAQQNQVAQNAARQFNAQSQNTAYNNYVAQQLAAQQANQGMDWNVGQLNTQMAQQAALANQLYGTGGFQAQIANQNAGLQGNQQNIGALSQIGSMGQGLGALGTQIGNYGQNIANMWGQAGGTLQGLGQNWYNQQTQNAGNLWGGPSSLANQGMGILGSMGGGQSGNVLQSSKQG